MIKFGRLQKYVCKEVSPIYKIRFCLKEHFHEILDHWFFRQANPPGDPDLWFRT
jgi:hypothetical protein